MSTAAIPVTILYQKHDLICYDDRSRDGDGESVLTWGPSSRVTDRGIDHIFDGATEVTRGRDCWLQSSRVDRSIECCCTGFPATGF